MSEPRKMYAVQITRRDGTTFMSSKDGDTPTIWAPCNRNRASKWAGELRDYHMKAKVVPVLYSEPTLL